MGRDVISYVARDMKPMEAESLDVLLVATDKVREGKLYRDLELVKKDFPDVDNKPSKVYRKVSALFNQGKTTMAPYLYRKVKIVGIDPPADPAALVDAIEKYRELDDEWELLLTDRDDTEYQKALIAFAESTEPTLAELKTGIEDHRKAYFAQTIEKDFAFSHPRGVAIYVNSLEEEGDAACIGNMAPFYPKRVTWKFKVLEGVGVAKLTEGEKDALDEQHINYMTKEYGRTYLKEGVCCDGEFIDALLGADYCAKRIRNKVYDILLANEDVPYSDNGFALICSGVTSALDDAVGYNIIAKDPESGKGMFTITLPTRTSCTDEQARGRIMPDIVWTAILEGAVHKVVVRGLLTVSLDALKNGGNAE